MYMCAQSTELRMRIYRSRCTYILASSPGSPLVSWTRPLPSPALDVLHPRAGDAGEGSGLVHETSSPPPLFIVRCLSHAHYKKEEGGAWGRGYVCNSYITGARDVWHLLHRSTRALAPEG